MLFQCGRRPKMGMRSWKLRLTNIFLDALSKGVFSRSNTPIQTHTVIVPQLSMGWTYCLQKLNPYQGSDKKTRPFPRIACGVNQIRPFQGRHSHSAFRSHSHSRSHSVFRSRSVFCVRDSSGKPAGPHTGCSWKWGFALHLEMQWMDSCLDADRGLATNSPTACLLI